MYQLLKYIFILLFLQSTITIVAQDYTLSYRALDNESELLGTRVNSFHEDKDGFIWIATQRGIARYDGHRFHWFTKTNSKLRGLPNQNKFVEDDEGFLWSVLIDKIDLINPKTLEIQSLEEKIGHELPFKGKINYIKQAKDNYIFIKSNKNEKWYRYHSSTGFQAIDFIPQKPKFIHVVGDRIWVRNFFENSLVAYHYKTGKKLKEVKIEDNRRLNPITNYALGKDRFWSTFNNTLTIWELEDGNAQKIFSFKNEGKKPPFWEFVFYLPKSDLLVTNFDGAERGLSIIDIKKQQLIPVQNSKKDGLPSLNIAWVNDQEMVWTRVKRTTLLLQIKKTHFHHYPPLQSIRGMKVLDNHIFTNRFKIPLDQPTDSQERGDVGRFLSVEPNMKDELWTGNANSIVQIDVQTNTVKKIIPSKFSRPNFWAVLKSQEGQWWAGSVGLGLFASNPPQNDSLFLYNQFNEFEELQKIRVTQLLEDGQHIWACSPIGLYLIHKQKGVVQRFNSEAKDAFRLPTEHVHFLYKDSNNIYWLATSSEGLIRFEVNQKFEITNYKRYTVEEGLSSNVVYCILEDNKERLWLSTLNGISCLDKKTGNIQVFNKGDGIQELEFNRISFAQAEDGRLFFGSLKGITAFYPDEVIKTGEYNIPIYLTQVYSYNKKDNERTDLTRQTQETNKIIIQPTDRIFRLNVAMLDVFNADKIRYSYKIEGLFNEFQSIEENIIEIGSLPYGRYSLKIRGQGADKRFSEQELIIPLIVVRPFYLKWWFITIAIFVLIASIFQIYQWRIRQLEERKNELEFLVMERTAQIRKDKATIEKDKAIIEEQAVQLKELDELKSKFFANISHELRTPLTLLLAPMDSIIESKENSNKNFTYLQMMRQNGKKLLKRINELLDLSRLDANRLEVNETPTFLYPFFKTLLSTFESSANLKEIELLFKYQLDENIQVKLDDDKVEKIISNYLSNALKFTPKQGKIEFNVAKKLDKLFISVRDTGIGILPNDLIKIFDRFYQTKKDNQQQGTGIGLSLCKELAKVLNGRVWATSEIGEGSIFYLELPLVETFAQKEITFLEEETIVAPVIKTNQQEKALSQIFRPNILIVEDNADLRQLLTTILEEEYNIIAVENGQEALGQLAVGSGQLTVGSQQSVLPTAHLPAKTRQAGCQLIISDIMMPVMDGIELLTKVKSTKNLQHIPMIMLTARQSLDVKIEALRIGVDDYLTKPFKEKELKARVANLINNSQNREVSTDISTSEKQPIKPISQADLKWLEKLEAILVRNIAQPKFKLSDAAEEMSIAYRTFQQKIKRITGLSPKQYQRSIKLAKARTILKSGEVETVSEVLYQVGFDNHYYFSKIYKEEFGIMPSEEL